MTYFYLEANEITPFKNFDANTDTLVTARALLVLSYRQAKK